MIWYLAAPYSSDVYAIRARRAELTAFALGYLLKRGEFAYAPTVMTHPVQACTVLPAAWDFWRAPSFDMLDRCDGLTVLCLPGWDTSTGVQAEIARAHAHGKPIRLMTPLPNGGYALENRAHLPDAESRMHDAVQEQQC